MSKFVYLIPLSPLIGFLVNGLFRQSFSKKTISWIGSGSILAAFVVSIAVFFDVKTNGSTTIHLFDFIKASKFIIPFAFQADALSALFLLIITGIGFLIHVYSTVYMHEEKSEHYARYFAYLNLFVFSMLLLVLGNNFVIMFIGWEGVGLCSYLLIGYWFKKKEYNYAAKKAFIMNRIGDLGFLLAIFWILFKLGTTTYHDVFAQVNSLGTSDLTIITLLLFVGAMGKSAQIPLYTWLPDAMAGPTPVSALIHAATMVTAGIYMIARSNIMYSLAPVTQNIVAIIGLSTALFAASIAIRQNDIKKVLAYSTVSQLGYMFLGLGVGAYTGAVFHVMTHAFFKALLFLGAGSVIHALHHEQDIRKMGGLKKYMPVTHITFLLACLAIAGIPPFSGFFSKDEILMAAYAVNPVYYYLGMTGALMTAFYMFRLYALTFTGNLRKNTSLHMPHESPRAMTFPLIILSVFAACSGFLGIPAVFIEHAHGLENFLSPIFADSKLLQITGHAVSHSQELLMMIIATIAIVLIIVITVRRYKKYAMNDQPSKGIARLLESKWYVDELYDILIVKPLYLFAGILKNVIERQIIDGFVNGIGRFVLYGSRQIRLLQTGQVGNYIVVMVLAIVVFIIIWFNDNAIMQFLKRTF